MLTKRMSPPTMERVWKKSYLQKGSGKALKNDRIHILKEVSLGVLVVDAPPVVNEYVEDREDDYEEAGGQFRLEPNCNHDASGETDEGEEEAEECPLSLKDYSDEQEDEEDTSSQLEAEGRSAGFAHRRAGFTHYFLLSSSLKVGSPAKKFFRETMESENTMRRPPMTDRLRRKKLMSKMRP